MVADTPPSRAGSLLQLDWVHLRNIGRLAGRLRWQASSHNWIGCIRKMLVGCQAAFAGRPAPTVECGYLQENGRLSGRLRGQASLLQWNVGTCKRMVGCQAAFAGKPRSYSGMWVPARDWSAVRPPSRASLAPTRGSVYTLRFSPLIRPSVSSPAFDLDLPAPSGGRVEAFIWGWARSAVRRSRTHREEVEAKPTGGDAPR